MNIYALKGHKVKYTEQGAKNGTSFDQEKANHYLVIENEYTVEKTKVHSWTTYVYLQEHPGICFNSVHFESITDQPEELNVNHPDYSRFN